MERLDALLTEWAEHEVNQMYRSGYSGINIIDKILHDPGVSSASKHRILWWPRNRRLARMSRAMHHIPKKSQLCVIVHYGRIVREEDGQILDKFEVNRILGIKPGEFDKLVSDARRLLNKLI